MSPTPILSPTPIIFPTPGKTQNFPISGGGAGGNYPNTPDNPPSNTYPWGNITPNFVWILCCAASRYWNIYITRTPERVSDGIIRKGFHKDNLRQIDTAIQNGLSHVSPISIPFATVDYLIALGVMQDYSEVSVTPHTLKCTCRQGQQPDRPKRTPSKFQDKHQHSRRGYHYDYSMDDDEEEEEEDEEQQPTTSAAETIATNSAVVELEFNPLDIFQHGTSHLVADQQASNALAGLKSY